MTEIDVVFLSASRTPAMRSLTTGALDSLAASEDPARIRFHPLVIESVPGTADYPGATMLFPSGKFGYHRFMNLGIRAGHAPYVCLCNNDLVFHPGWASEILQAFEADPALMSASPYCGYFHPSVHVAPHADILAGYENGIHVTGWCLFVRREIFNFIGELDERFVFWYCDDDYRFTLRQHGLKHALVVRSKVDHLGSRTLAGESDARRKDSITARQKLFFQYKWEHRSRLLYWLKQLNYSLKHWRQS
jgi:GT2 family glycosyltransferase